MRTSPRTRIVAAAVVSAGVVVSLVMANAPTASAKGLLPMVGGMLFPTPTPTPAPITFAPEMGPKTGTGGIATADLVGPLSVSGNQIFDSNGTRVALRGVNVSRLVGFATSPKYSESGDASIAAMKAAGANFVRVMLNESFWNTFECSYQARYASAVDGVVNSITSRGMVAMLDLHMVTRAPCTKAGKFPMPSTSSTSFWSTVADRYKANPLVAFDLFNEPHDVTEAVWRSGGSVTAGGVTYQAIGMQTMIDAIRAAGATDQLIFASGFGWATNPPTGGPLSGGKIVYAVHYYTCPHSVGECTTSQPMNPATSDGQRLNVWSGIAASYPVVVTEFGWPDSNADGAYLRNVIQWAEWHAQGWSAFVWEAGNSDANQSSSFGLLQDIVSFQPNGNGQAAFDGMQAYR